METILHGLTAQLFDSNFDHGDRTFFEDGISPSSQGILFQQDAGTLPLTTTQSEQRPRQE